MTNTELIARWTKSDVKQVNQALRRGDDDFDALPWGPVDNRADLRGIRLCGHFKKVRWRNLDLSFCNGDDAFIHVRMSDCLLKRASLGAYCGDVLERCDLSGATLKELSGTFSDCDFTRAVARFVNGHAMAEFLRCDFSEVHLIKCCFPGCRFGSVAQEFE